MYGLNAARQPDGEANVDLLLGEYRKLDPGPFEEFIFYRSSQRANAHHGGDALEGGASGDSVARGNEPAAVSVEVTSAWLLPCPRQRRSQEVRFYFAVGGGTTSCSFGLSRKRLNSSSL